MVPRAVCPSDSQYPEIRGSTGCLTVMDGWGGGAYDSAGTIPGAREFLVYDIAADQDVSAAWKTMGGDSLIGGYGVGAAYDSRADRLMGWIGGGVFMLDMDTRIWTRMSAVGAPVNQIVQGTFGRFRYDPDDDVFVLANGVDEDMYFYKPPAGAGAAVKAVTGARFPS